MTSNFLRTFFLTASLPALLASGPAVAQSASALYSSEPIVVELPTTCSAEANRRGFKDQARSSFLAECRRQRMTARSQQAQKCMADMKGRHLWGLAKHKVRKRCMAELKSFVVPPNSAQAAPPPASAPAK